MMCDVNPINYKIHLEPDLNRFLFSGRVEILVQADKAIDVLSLNILDLAIWRAKARVGKEYVSCPFSVDPKKETLRISFPREMAGEIEVAIDYAGEINEKMAGFYRSRYMKQGKERYIAVTQFEESDARRAFPCLDHPVKKATFEIEMLIDEARVGISNTAVMEERVLDDGRKLIRFQRTPKMSTYLLFFGVGDFDFIEDQGDVLVRVAAVPGMTRYAGFGLAFGRKSLEYCEDYYGIKYPLSKLDLIAIPDFAFGAMENWGAITFRENLLLHYPNITSKAGEERICEVLAHEMAHQWFGDLVTPSDWKYLWLNESFATYFGYGMVHHYYPDWDVWDQFLHGQVDTALDRDALLETFPIEIPGGEHVVINASTAPIIYNKGGSILRQVEGYMGSDDFRTGLRHYLKRHEFACASSHHLWEALEAVSQKPITDMMKSWIEQSGFPLVEVKRDRNQLILTQKRFSYLSNESEQSWIIPVILETFGIGGAKTVPVLLDGRAATLDMGKDVNAYKVNSGQTGFYRVRYLEKDNLVELGKCAARRELSPTDRWGLQNDLYALALSRDIPIDEYLDFVSNYYSGEEAYLPLSSISSNLYHAYLIMEGSRREKIASMGRSLFERVLSDIGYEPRQEERHNISILRDHMLWHAALLGSGEATGFAMKEFSALMKEKRVHQDIMRSVMQVGALNGGPEVMRWFERRLESSESEHDRMNILSAMGSFRERPLIETALEFTLAKVPDRNKFVPIQQMAVNPYAIPGIWEWYVSHLDRLEQLHPVHYERVIGGIVPYGGLGREEQVRVFFKDYLEKKEKARDVIKLSLERLEINSMLRGSESQGKERLDGIR